MKKIIYLLVIFPMLAFMSCSKNNDNDIEDDGIEDNTDKVSKNYTHDDYFQWDAVGNVITDNKTFNSTTTNNASNSCKNCPTRSQIIKYLKEDCYWDSGIGTVATGKQTCIVDGQSVSSGIWLKKKEYITDFNVENDFSTNYQSKKYHQLTEGNAVSIRKSGKYFFLPAAGYYNGGVYDQGYQGFYWSSTPSSDSSYAYCMSFAGGGAVLYGELRDYGRLPWVAK